MKVLVVEDNRFNMELVAEILKAQGFSVDEAFDGAEAIKKTEKDIYDLIIMDLGLPDMNGFEITRIIKSKPQYEDVPVIAFTAYAMEGDRQRFLEAGFNDYMPKPIHMADFVKKLEKYKV